MRSRTTCKFWRLFDDLPEAVQQQVRETYRLWRADPSHPSLRFKKVSVRHLVYSVRIGIRHRALGVLEGMR